MNRQTFIQTAAMGAAATAVGGCALLEDKEMRLCTLEEARSKPFIQGKFNGHLVMLTHPDKEMVVFSLTCRHKKCTVKWKEEARQFQCPCHEGRYDHTGKVIDGPPPAPLHRFQHEVRTSATGIPEVWVLNAYAV